MAVTEIAPLRGVRVLELSGGYAAGLAGRFLRGYGADLAHFDPGFATPMTADEIAYVHAGKRSLLVGSTEADEWRRLLADVDIVLSDVQPGGLQALGIDWEAHRAEHPLQVIVSVTPFGLTGPYADHQHTNAVAFALGGIMSLTGDASRTPLVTGGNQAYALGAGNAFAAAVTLWLGRLRHGRGDLADISGQECAAGMLEYYGAYTSYTGLPMTRLGNQTRATWAIYPCLDGWAGVFALERQTPALFRLLDDPELAEPRFREPAQRQLPENDEELAAKLYVYFADKTMAELRATSLSTRVPMGTATTPTDLLASDGLAERGAFDRVDTEGTSLIPGRPFPGFGWRGALEAESAADSVADGAVVWAADRPGAPAATLVPEPGPTLPLAGIRVIDLTMMWAGPYATLRMAEMGADVIKVESPSAWDNIRTLIPQPDVTDPWNSAFYFNAYNRDKRSLTLDLAQPDGRELLLRLVTHADVLIENYRADVLDKLGLGADVLHATNPRLAVISMAAFGKYGPQRDYVGFGPVIELMSGLASLSGYGDGEPFKTGISYGDPVAGTAAVAATALALLRRELSSEPVHVDLAQLETGMVLIGEAFVAAGRGEEPVHRGCRDARFAPQGCYPVVGDDQWLVLSIRTDDEWRRLCDEIGVAEDDELRALTNSARHVRHDEIDARIRSWSVGTDPQAAMDRLQGAGLAAGRVLDTIALLEDPHLGARRFWVALPHPKMHAYRQQGAVWRLADGRPAPRRHSPLFGEHNAEILQGLLEVTDEEMAQLMSASVIADAPINPGVG